MGCGECIRVMGYWDCDVVMGCGACIFLRFDKRLLFLGVVGRVLML